MVSGRLGARPRDLMIAAGLPALFAGVAISWVLAQPSGPGPVAWPTAVSLGASVLLVGLGGLPTIGATPSARTVGVIAAIWLQAVLVSAWLRTADQAGVAPARVDIGQFGEVMTSGASELLVAVAAVLVLAWVVVDLLTEVSIPVTVVAGLAAIGLLATAVSGHASVHTWGPVVVGVHALAASWWCGTLAAMVLSVRGRSGWATTLPVFSTRATWAAGVVAVSGIVVAVIELGGVSGLFTTGYGRVLCGKLVGLGVLAGVGWWHRRRWVPSASRHRVDEQSSIRHGVIEVALMAVVLGLAAGLSVTANQ